MDSYPPAVQRPALLKFIDALGAREASLHRDECGDWRIVGQLGHIYAVPGSLHKPKTPGFQILVLGCETARQWGATKSQITPFADITNDGDTKGAFFLDHLPTHNQAEIIRRYVGIRKKRQDSEATLAGLREHASKYHFQPKSSAPDDPEAQ